MIQAGAVYDRGTIVRWLGGRKCWRRLQEAGLRSILLGRRSFVLGSEVVRVFAELQGGVGQGTAKGQ